LIDQLLYKQAITSLYAPGGSGKTIMALWIAMLVMEQGLNVVYVDEENGQLRIAERLQQLGADPDTVAEHFLYADGPGLTLDAGNLAMWEATIEQAEPALVIFDPFADLLALSNLEENSAGDVTKWMKAFAQPVKERGGAILILDHVMKDDGGKYARGSSAKHAKVAAAWKLKVETEFDRNTVGEVSISSLLK
jgi:RecA-family ATPase